MPPCPACQQPAAKRNGRDRRGRQKYACRQCRRTFTGGTTSAFSGYRWAPNVILTAVRWYLSYPLSGRQVRELLAERGFDVAHRTILTWVQVFGPMLAAEVRHRRRVGRRCFVDEVFLFRKSEKRYLYRAIDEDGGVVAVLLRDHRETARAEVLFRQAIERASWCPKRLSPTTTNPLSRLWRLICPRRWAHPDGLHRAFGETA